MKELNNMKVEKYDVVVKVDIISNSMDLLKEWSKKNTYNIIFDSNINGDGTNKKLLYDKLMNKSNLYFISFDDNDNVYGGYVNKKIDQLGDYNVKFNCYVIYDKQSFVFSLIRNGKVNNKRYFLKQSQSVALGLYDNSPLGGLYEFGNDMRVHKVGSDDSWCNNEDCFYDYKQDNNPFTDIIYPKKFAVQRIVVIEMN